MRIEYERRLYSARENLQSDGQNGLSILKLYCTLQKFRRYLLKTPDLRFGMTQRVIRIRNVRDLFLIHVYYGVNCVLCNVIERTTFITRIVHVYLTL